MKKAHVIAAVLIAGFAALGLSQMRSSLTSYVGFAEARAAGRTVQIKGKIDHPSVRCNATSGEMSFSVTDPKGSRMRIVYPHPAPANFAQASHVVAAGCYQDGAFHASQLLVKCPSKYQGQSYPAGR